MRDTRNEGFLLWIVLVLLHDEHDVRKSDWCSGSYFRDRRNLLLRRARFNGARRQHQFPFHKETFAA
jgi:hypothetical protein